MLPLKGNVPINSSENTAIDRNYGNKKIFFIIGKH